jgi:excisionase family DNA binding protein
VTSSRPPGANGAGDGAGDDATSAYRSRPGSSICWLDETVSRLGMHRQTAYALIAAGEFPVPAHRLGRRWYVRRVDLDEFLGTSS